MCEEAVELLQAFYRKRASSERAVSRPTIRRMLSIGNALRECRAECNLAELSAISGADCFYHLGPKASWPSASRTALAACARAENGRLKLGLRMSTMNAPWVACWLVTLDGDQRVLDCAVVREADFGPSAVLALLSPLTGPLYRGVLVTVTEAQRLFAPQLHPLRTRLPLEYAVRVDRGDRSPSPQADLMATDPRVRRPNLTSTVARTLAMGCNSEIFTHDSGLPFRNEVLISIDGRAIVLTRPMPDPGLTNRQRLTRARELARDAVALSRGRFMGNTQAYKILRSREAPLPLENAILLLNVLDAAGVGPQTVFSD